MKVLASNEIKANKISFLRYLHFCLSCALCGEKISFFPFMSLQKKQMKLLSVIIMSVADFIVLVKFLLGLWGQRLQHDCCGKMNTNFLSP